MCLIFEGMICHLLTCDEMWWNVMTCDEMRDVMKCDLMSCDEMRCDEVWWGSNMRIKRLPRTDHPSAIFLNTTCPCHAYYASNLNTDRIGSDQIRKMVSVLFWILNYINLWIIDTKCNTNYVNLFEKVGHIQEIIFNLGRQWEVTAP